MNFGKFIPIATLFDDSVTKDNRDFLWDINVEIQHRVMRRAVGERRLQPQLGRQLHGAWRTRCSAPRASTSTALRCRTIRGCRMLGSEQCGYYDVKPRSSVRARLRVTNAKEFGKQKRYWDGFWFGVNGPPAEGHHGGRRTRHRPPGRRPLPHRRHAQPAERHHRQPAARRRAGAGGGAGTTRSAGS